MIDYPEIMHSVENFAGRVVQSAKADFDAMFKSLAQAHPTVVSNLLHLADAIEQNGGLLLIQLAQSAVAAAEAKGGATDMKFEAARQAVAQALHQRGLPVVWNAVNGAIEAAVAAINASAGVDLSTIPQQSVPSGNSGGAPAGATDIVNTGQPA